jgi:hypothetical protein
MTNTAITQAIQTTTLRQKALYLGSASRVRGGRNIEKKRCTKMKNSKNDRSPG